MRSVPEWAWAPASAAVLTAVLGATGIWAGLPWLFPSLGPTIFLQVHHPDLPSSRPYNLIMGHALGAAAAFAAVAVTGASAAPSVLSSNELSWPRIWAAVIAMGVTLLSQVVARASHPPAAATALLVALGGFSLAWRDAAILAAGVLLVAIVGEALRRLRRFL